MSRVRVVAFTDVGLRRQRNEDAVLVAGWLCQSHDGAVVTMDFASTAPFVCVVADGMGGHAGGNVASRTALGAIAEGSPQWRTVDDVAATISTASDQVRTAGANLDLHGLGTTVAGVGILGEGVVVFNVGDSRVYSITGDRLQQLSRDDAVFDAAGNPTNVITQSLGQEAPVQTHVTTLPLLPGLFLVCSDGVSGKLDEAELHAAFLAPQLSECAANIVAATRGNGADDNFSFIIISIPDLDSEDTEPREVRTAASPLPSRPSQWGAPGPARSGWRQNP